MRLVIRLLLLLAGLAFAVSLAIAASLLFSIWLVRSAWARLTGQPVHPFIVGAGPRAGFERMRRRAAAASSRTPRADAAGSGRSAGNVTDVEWR